MHDVSASVASGNYLLAIVPAVDYRVRVSHTKKREIFIELESDSEYCSSIIIVHAISVYFLSIKM